MWVKGLYYNTAKIVEPTIGGNYYGIRLEFGERRNGESAAPPGRPFEKNNPGRKPGSKNKSTLIATTLSGEQGEVLLSKAIEMAEGGNVVMMKFLLERILPKERIVPITLPRLDSALDCINAMSAIAAAVSDGQITTREAAELTKVVDTFVRSIEITELEREAEILRRQLDPQKADLDSVRSHKGRGTGWPK